MVAFYVTKLLPKICAGLLGVLLLAGCNKAEPEMPAAPLEINVWHYYNGVQKQSFDELVEEFNRTIGQTEGTFVVGHNYGDVNQLMEHVTASVNHEVGSMPMPDIFACYADTAYPFEEQGLLADLGQYFTEEEQAQYVSSYLEEGRIGQNGELRIFPIAKSTEVLMLNKTDWDIFAASTGVKIEELASLEGVIRTAQKYYDWTDSLTPDILDDGRAFYGRDAVANLFTVGAQQLGADLFIQTDGKVSLQLDKAVMRRLWDVYYRPHLYGYFYAQSKFRSDDAKAGAIIALTGSSSGVSFFPTEVTRDDKTYPIEVMVLPNPILENAQPCAVQQGAGMAVSKSDPAREKAAVTFLKWFTDDQRNLSFSRDSGYLPVRKDANNFELFTQVMGQLGQTPDPVVSDTLKIAFETVNSTPLYSGKSFASANEARRVLNFSLPDKLQADIQQRDADIAAGTPRAQAIEKLDTDENFESWYASFEQALQQAMQEK